MRTTVTIDDSIYDKAVELLDPDIEKSEIFREAMKAFIRLQTGKRLAALGGSIPGMQDVPRRRPEPENIE